MHALLRGDVEVLSATAAAVAGRNGARRVRIIGVLAAQRLAGELASAPTWVEQGVNAVISAWRGVLGLPKMSEEQKAYWDGVFEKIVRSTEWSAELDKYLWESNYLKSSDSQNYLDSQYAELASILKERGLSA